VRLTVTSGVTGSTCTLVYTLSGTYPWGVSVPLTIMRAGMVRSHAVVVARVAVAFFSVLDGAIFSGGRLFGLLCLVTNTPAVFQSPDFQF